MNTLLAVDPDRATDALARPPAAATSRHCGFQYRSSHTYWPAGCVVAKVLAPTSRGAAGWVGPGRPAADLGRTQAVRVRSRRPRRRGMRAADVESMRERSRPLGPRAGAYPVADYGVPAPLTERGFVVDAVRVERLGFRPVTANMEAEATSTAARGEAVPLFDATIQFAIDGLSWPLRLAYDVDFIAAWPCADGPHPLFYDYLFRAVRVDELVHVRPRDDAADDEEVLVVEAFGVGDNEALARAWCSHWGLSAVVADVGGTWYVARSLVFRLLISSSLACAVREAYAATLTVVVLVDDGLRDVEDG